MTVIVHGQPDATPAEIQAALLAWRKAERTLQQLPYDDEGEAPSVANGS